MLRVAALAILVFVIRPLADFAEDDEQFLRVSGSYSTEFNFGGTGNAVVFSPDDDSGKSFPSKQVLTDDDRLKLLWRNSINLNLQSDYGTIEMIVYANSDDLNWPDSAGLRARLLLPVDYISENLNLGIYHDSSHNLAEERYGRGTDITGPYVALNCFKTEGGSFFRCWGAYAASQNDATPFIFTDKVNSVTLDDLENISWLSGLEWHRKYSNADAFLAGAIRASDEGPAAATVRMQVLYWVADNILVGPFVEYNWNLRETDLFGQGEWLFGPMLQVRF